MTEKKSIAASHAKAKAEGLQLPHNTPVASQAPARESAVEVHRSPAKAAKPAKPADMPLEPTVVVKKVEPTVVAKKTARKSIAKGAQQAPALKTAAPSRPRAQPAGKPSKRPGKIVGVSDPIAEGREMIATLETCGTIAAKGAESLGKEVASLARGSVQAQLALTEALINAKTLQEALVLQGNFASESLGNMTEGFAKLTGMSMELSQTIMAPIHARVSDTARTIWRRAV